MMIIIINIGSKIDLQLILYYLKFSNKMDKGIVKEIIMRVLLIDDEKLALDMLEVLLNRMNGIEIVGKYQNPELALQNLEKLKVEVIFLDMDMGGVHGIKFAERIMAACKHIEVIFVTAHPQFALDAFEVSAIDYLLKPVSFNRLTKAIAKAEEKLKMMELKKASGAETKKETLLAFTMSNFRLIDFQQNIIKWRTKKVKELFIYLWHNRELAVHKARIIEELWPNTDVSKAMVLLHTTIYQLRKALKEYGIEKPVTLLNDQYVLSVSLTSDVHELEELFRLENMTAEDVEKVLELYTGDYLEEEGYTWATRQQLTLRQSLFDYLEKFITASMEKQESGQLVEACLEKMLQLDTFNEAYMLKLIDHFGQSNQFNKLQLFYKSIKNKFEYELGIQVPKEINELYDTYLNKLKPLISN